MAEIDDLSDRPSKWGQSTSLRQAAASDKLDKDLMFLDPAFFPPGLWEAHFEDDEKTKSRCESHVLPFLVGPASGKLCFDLCRRQ